MEYISYTNYKMSLDDFNNKKGKILFCIYNCEPVFVSDNKDDMLCPICKKHRFLGRYYYGSV